MRKLSLTFVAVGIAVGSAAIVPAHASTSNGTTVAVSVANAGTRQLDVLDLSGNALTTLPLVPGTPAPFRVRVTDNNISNLLAPNSGFSVSARMNNLYLKDGVTHVWGTSIPSSDVSLSYATDPLSAFGVSLDDLPQVAVSGTLPNCTSLQTAGILTAPNLTTTAAPLCALLGVAGSGLSVPSFNVTSVLGTTLSPLTSNLLDLPFQISGNESGNFTNPDYASGIGASDPNATATAGTPRRVLQGVAGMTSTLQDEITSALGSVPSALTSATGTNSKTSVSALVTALSASSNGTLQSLGNALSSLTTSQQVSILNQLTGALVVPGLGDLSNVAGTYNAFPLLTAAAGNAVTGTYEGTMTITLVQQ
jgi:hypothetical protein